MIPVTVCKPGSKLTIDKISNTPPKNNIGAMKLKIIDSIRERRKFINMVI